MPISNLEFTWKWSAAAGDNCGARFGLAAEGIDIKAGTIDPDYRGEIKVIVHNDSGIDIVVTTDKAIAQMTFQPLMAPSMAEVQTTSELCTTD